MTQSTSSKISSFLWFGAFIAALYPFNALDLEFFAACIVMLYAWSYFLFTRNLEEGWAVPKSPVLLFSALFFLLTMASLLWSEVKPVTLLSVCLFSALPITFLTWAIRPDPRAFKTIAFAFVPLSFILALWAVAQYYLLHDYFGGQARHPLADPSSLGALFSLFLFCALGWMVSGPTVLQRRLALALAAVLVAGIIATVSRGALFAMIPALGIFAFLLWPAIKAVKGHFLAFIAVIIIIVPVMHLTGGPDEKIASRLEKTVTMTMLDGDITNMRGYLWESTLRMIKDRPFLGTGFGTYYLYLPEYKDNDYPAPAYHAHADPLEYWAELGIFGPILFYAMLVAAAIRTSRALKILRDKKGPERVVIVTTFCALGAMIIHTHVSFNLYNLSILMVSGFLLAVWFYTTGAALREKVTLSGIGNTSAPVAKIIVLLPFLILAGLFLRTVAGEHYAGRALDNLFDRDMESFAENINKSGDVSGHTTFRSYLFAVNVPLSLLQIDMASMDLAQRRELYDQAVGYMENVLAINPRSEAAYYYMGRAQELAGPGAVPKDAPSREELYTKALQINPMHLGARLALYRLAKANGESLYKQIDILEPAKDMYFNLPIAEEYYRELAILYLETGNSRKSREIMDKMAQFQKRSEFSREVRSLTIPGALMRSETETP